MVKRDLEKEKQLELAAVWGSEVDGDARFPKRRGSARKKIINDPSTEGDNNVDLEEVPSDIESEMSEDLSARKTAGKTSKKAARKERQLEYRLHCFVEPGTEINAVRTAFEAYDPKVELRTSQKGNLLNKTQFAVLTFRNKAMALHAVKTLDGTNQRDLLGVKQVKLSLMLSRHQSKIARKKTNKKLKTDREKRMMDETNDDLEFVSQFIKQHSAELYEGDVEAHGAFGGKGALKSSMGFAYKGDFVAGRIEGLGTMEWARGCVVDGNFKDGIANGTCTMTWPDGSVYNGSVVNGVRHGAGTLTSDGGRAAYEGEWVRGVRCGWGRQCYPDGSVYEGKWADGMRNGHGVLVYGSNDTYDGNWLDDKREGHGVMGWKNGGSRFVELYDGLWKDGLPHGEGRSTYIDYVDRGNASTEGGSASREVNGALPSCFCPPVNCVLNVFRGAYANGTRDGMGTFFYADGSSYEGMWSEGVKDGDGRFTSASGAVHEIKFARGVPVNASSLSSLSAGPGAAVVPAVNILDLFSLAENSEESMLSRVSSLILRFNTPLRVLFANYAAHHDNISLAYTSPDWWRHRLPGHISIPQLLRLLNDAGLLRGLVTCSCVLRCVSQVLQAEPYQENKRAGGAATVANGSHRLPLFHAGRQHDEQSDSRTSALCRADGWLNFRQFVETLVRFSRLVAVGVSGGAVGDRFSRFAEAHLRSVPAETRPLCPLTRAHADELSPLLPGLEKLYGQLQDLEHLTVVPGRSFLPVHALLRYVQPLLRECEIPLEEAISIAMPHQFEQQGTETLPPGFSIVSGTGGQQHRALAQELFAAGCKDTRSGTSLLVSGVMVELELSLVDFVECLVLLAFAVSARLHIDGVAAVFTLKVLPLPL